MSLYPTTFVSDVLLQLIISPSTDIEAASLYQKQVLKLLLIEFCGDFCEYRVTLQSTLHLCFCLCCHLQRIPNTAPKYWSSLKSCTVCSYFSVHFNTAKNAEQTALIQYLLVVHAQLGLNNVFILDICTLQTVHCLCGDLLSV